MSPNQHNLTFTVRIDPEGNQQLACKGSTPQGTLEVQGLIVEFCEMARSYQKSQPCLLLEWNLSVRKRSYQNDYILSAYVDVFAPERMWIGEVSVSHRAERRIKLRELCNKLCFELIELLENNLPGMKAKKAPLSQFSGVLIRSQASGMWVHEMFGHGLLAEESPEILDQLANSQIEIFDDPTLPERVGSYTFDDTGVAASPVKLSSLELSLLERRTGRQRSEGSQFIPTARPTNTWANGPHSSLEPENGHLVIEKVGLGVFLDGSFYLKTQQAYLQKKGKKVWLNPLMIGGEISQTLSHLRGAGDALVWGSSLCSDRSGILPTAHGGPTFAFSEVEYIHEL